MTTTHRVLLIHPGIYMEDNPLLFPPWGVLAIASQLRAQGTEVQVADLNGVDLERDLPRKIGDFQPTVLGITGKMGLGARRMQLAARIARDLDPELRIAVGGPLVASFPDPDDDLWVDVDALFQGDGEEAFSGWLTAGCPSGMFTAAPAIADLEISGIPTWWDGLSDYVRPAEFWPNMDVPSMHIATARGCTRRCTFCYLRTQYPTTMFRFVSPDRLLRDLDDLHHRFGASGFYFVDDCFIDRPPRRARAVCERLIDRGAPYRFGCDVQWPDLENDELLVTMHLAGFRCLYLGLEAASSEVRRRLGKGRIAGQPAKVLQNAIDLGFLIRASIGIGWPGETEADIKDTLALIDAVPDLLFDGYRYLPLPGVPLTQQWARDAGPDGLDRTRALAFQDYSLNNDNFSSIPDARYEQLWLALLRRQDERLERAFAVDA